MKPSILIPLLVAALSSAAPAADYSVFRVCQDKRVIRTSDGAEGGHVEYIVVEPSSHRVVSTVVTGGVVGERLVAVPFSSVSFASEGEITLNEITRERLISAPVIERTQINTTVIQPTIIERTYTHFGVRADTNVQNTSVQGRSNVSTESRTTSESPAKDQIAPPASATSTRTEVNPRGRRQQREGNAAASTAVAPPATEPAAPREEAGSRTPPAPKPERGAVHEENATAAPANAQRKKSGAAGPATDKERGDAKPAADNAEKSARAAAEREKVQVGQKSEQIKSEGKGAEKAAAKTEDDVNKSAASATAKAHAEEPAATATKQRRPDSKGQKPADEKRSDEQRQP